MTEENVYLLHQNIYTKPVTELTIGRCIKFHTNITLFALVSELKDLKTFAKGNQHMESVIELRMRQIRRLIKKNKADENQETKTTLKNKVK